MTVEQVTSGALKLTSATRRVRGTGPQSSTSDTFRHCSRQVIKLRLNLQVLLWEAEMFLAYCGWLPKTVVLGVTRRVLR